MNFLRQVLQECEHRGMPIPGGIDKVVANADENNVRQMAKQLRGWQVKVVAHVVAPLDRLTDFRTGCELGTLMAIARDREVISKLAWAVEQDRTKKRVEQVRFAVPI